MPKKIEKEIEEQIYSLKKEGKNQKEIASLLGISYATVGRYCKKIRAASEETKVVVKEKQKTTDINSDFSVAGLTFDQTRIVKAGLINNRHVIPVDEFIFDSITDDKIFDFDWMDQVVKKFILDRIDFVNDEQGRIVGSKKLYLYVTGLSSALASVVKICSELSVNLTLLHYDFESNTYKHQKIFERFKQMKNRLVGDIFKNNGLVILKDCSLSDIYTNEFYLIEKVNFDSMDKANRERDYYICSKYQNFWRLYGEICADIATNTQNKKITIFAYLAKIENESLIKEKFLGRNSNFRE